MRSQVSRRPDGSRPVVGSSRKRRSGLPMIPRPTSRRRCWPPDSRLMRSSRLLGEPDQLDHLVDRTRVRVVAGIAREDLPHRVIGLDGQLLQHHPDARAEPTLRAVVRRIDAERLHPSAGPVPEALEDLDGGGLAGSVGPEEREDLALLHLEADVAHRHGVAVGLRQVLYAHRRHGHPVFPAASTPKPATGGYGARHRLLERRYRAPPTAARSGGRRHLLGRAAARRAPAASSVATRTLSSRSRNWRSSDCDRAEKAVGGTESTWSISVATALPASVSTMILTRRS